MGSSIGVINTSTSSCTHQNSITGSPAPSGRPPAISARDYVESLHQNNKATLLYGKNNVHVQPVSVFGILLIFVHIKIFFYFCEFFYIKFILIFSFIERTRRSNAWIHVSPSKP